MNKRLVIACLFFVAGTGAYSVAERGRRRATVSDGEVDERSTAGYAARHVE